MQSQLFFVIAAENFWYNEDKDKLTKNAIESSL